MTSWLRIMDKILKISIYSLRFLKEVFSFFSLLFYGRKSLAAALSAPFLSSPAECGFLPLLRVIFWIFFFFVVVDFLVQ